MVTTTTATFSSTATKNNNASMLLYNNAPTVSIANSSGGINSCNTSTLEQYRLQLYNYALNMERLRGPPYTAAAMAAAAACALNQPSEQTTSTSGSSVHGSNYTTSQVQPPPPPPYICATSSGLISAPSHMRHTSTLTPCPSNRLALASMSLFPQRIFQPEDPKPQHSYIGLIAMAILSSAETKLVLSDIYQYILDNYPYFRTRGPGWRNSIRHNLSLNDCFIKSGRSANGKGHYWAIHPANMEDFRKGDFRRRKAQRKVRKHMGLAVDDNGTDSPSPPPAMDLTSPSPPSLSQHCASIMGGTITPIATTAQQLAAHSFGWRFTHHRPQQHHPQVAAHTPTASAASYMGQIFTYRPQQQNSITTHYAAAAAAAAAMCNSSATQKHHHQQHLIATTTTSHHQQIENYLQHQKSISFISSSYHDKSEQRDTSSSTNVNAINELFSQKRKRQFDVASLLAPDNMQKRDHNTYMQNDNPVSLEVTPPLSFHDDDDDDDENPKPSDLEIEDIDVVEASEDEDVEGDFEQDYEDDSNCNSLSHDEEESLYTQNSRRRLKNHCEMTQLNISEDESGIKVQEHTLEENDDNDDLEKNIDNDEFNFNNNQTQQHINNNNNNNNRNNNSKNICILKQNPTAVSAYDFFTHSQYQRHNQTSLCVLSTAAIPAIRAKTTTTSPPSPPTVNQILEFNDHNQNLNQLPLNGAHQLIGRYYDTYMAAAAAARINTSVPANIVSKID